MTVGASTGQNTAAVQGGSDGQAVQWLLRRNCSLAPRQMLRLYLSLSAVCLSIGVLFWWLGATLVLPFAGVEVLALGVALLVYARHAADSEHIRLERGVLSVEQDCGGRIERIEFRPGGVRIEAWPGDVSLIEVSGQGRRVVVGRLVRPEVRRQLADELRREMRRACQGPDVAVWVGSRTDDVTRR